jgi:maltose/moltooligosaccharide transporter
MNKPRLSFWQMYNMSFGFVGIQFGWGLQLANMSAVYERLGAREQQQAFDEFLMPATGALAVE